MKRDSYDRLSKEVNAISYAQGRDKDDDEDEKKDSLV